MVWLPLRELWGWIGLLSVVLINMNESNIIIVCTGNHEQLLLHASIADSDDHVIQLGVPSLQNSFSATGISADLLLNMSFDSLSVVYFVSVSPPIKSAWQSRDLCTRLRGLFDLQHHFYTDTHKKEDTRKETGRLLGVTSKLSSDQTEKETYLS